MLNTRTWYFITALLLGLAAIEQSSADSPGKPSEALVPPTSAQDYRFVSKMSFQRASKHNRLNQTQAACEALTMSLDYYRMALAKDNLPARELVSFDGDGGDGMQEIRSRFGCTRTQFG